MTLICRGQGDNCGCGFPLWQLRADRFAQQPSIGSLARRGTRVFAEAHGIAWLLPLLDGDDDAFVRLLVLEDAATPQYELQGDAVVVTVTTPGPDGGRLVDTIKFDPPTKLIRDLKIAITAPQGTGRWQMSYVYAPLDARSRPLLHTRPPADFGEIK